MKKLSFFLMAMLVSLTSFAAALGEGYEKVTNISTLAAGDKVVLYCDDSSVGVTGVNGTKDAAVAATGWVEYLVEAATGGVKLKDTGASKYISLTTKNTFTYATTGSVCKVNANGLLCITLSGSDFFLYQNGTYYRMYVDKTGNSGYKPFYVYKVVPVEVNPDATMYTVTVKSADETMGTVTGGGEYAEGKTATLEASPKAGYEFVKWSNGSTENPLKLTVTEDIELTATFQAQTPITIAEANQLKDAAKCILKEFTVAYIYKSYIHIQDASGYGMIYAGSFGLKAGDVVTGFTCSKSTYNGLPQFTPTCKLADLTVVAGEAPAVAELTTAPTGNYHQVVKLMNLTMTGSFNTSSNTTVKATCPDGTTIDIFNGKNHTYTFVAGKTYNITGDVCQYSGKIQVSTYAIEEYVAPVVNHTIAVSANPAEAGTVTGAGEYEEGTEATLTATANEGYEFVNWTENEEEVSTNAEYTFEVLADRALVANFKKAAPATETVYFINAKKWAKVNVYAWTTDPIVAWPGAAATKEAEQIAGYDVYSYTLNAGAAANVIFNDGSSQTPDLVWTAGKYYVIDMGWLTKEEAETKLAAPLPETWNIVGAAGLMGKDWDLNAAENAMTKQEDGTYKLEKKGITIVAGTYEYKAAKDHGWTVAIPQDGNQKLTISTSGIYDVTFVLDVTAKKLTATATLKQAAVVIPTIVIAGDMNSWSQTKDKFTMSADSLTATFKATLAVKNYGFKMIVGGAWHSDGKTITRAANSTKFTGANSNTNSTLKADIAGEYLFTWEYATKTLTVTYPALPVKYNVTVTAEHGTVTGAGTYEEGKTATLTATPAEGYEFVNWTVGEEVVSTENPYTFTVNADIALVANFKAVEPEIEWIEMPLEITNLVTVVMEVGGAKYLQLAGRNDMNDADVTLFLNNYADVDDDYEVNAENSYMTFGGMEFTVIEGVMTQTSETDKGTIYTGTVYASVTDEEEGGTMYVKFALTMYAAPATVLELTDAIVAINEKLGTLTFNVATGEGEGYFVELSGYTAPGVHEGPQICLFETPEVVAYATYVETSVADGVITLKGEFVSPNGPKFDLTISGKLPVVEPEVITYELNGGEFPEVKVPTNAELWGTDTADVNGFMHYYNHYYNLKRATQTIENVASFAYAQMQQIMTDEASEYKWLGDYIQTVATAAGKPLSTDMAAPNESGWRWSVWAFFNACEGKNGSAGIDFTEAGKPEVWGAAYEAEYGVVLPTEPVDEDYVLPTPVKEGYTFVGWYDNAEGTGEPYKVIPAGWAGTLYAIWKQGTTTALENIAVEGKAVKAIINGQLIIIKNGVQYNAQGQVVK